MKIRLEDVYFRYEEDEKYIFEGLNLELDSNEMISIIGHNGSGKTTLSKIILGLVEIEKGNIYIDDELMTEDNIEKLRLKMGIVFQNPDNQFVGVTVKDDIAFGLENRRIPRIRMNELIDKYLKVVGMSEYSSTAPEELSGGQKQRVAVAGILACDPELIIFDEATSMLDPVCTKDIIGLIKELKMSFNKTIILITHNLVETIFSDRIILLNNGKIVLDGKPQVVFKETKLLEASGLVNLDSIQLLEELSNLSYRNKKEIEQLLWQLSFEM